METDRAKGWMPTWLATSLVIGAVVLGVALVTVAQHVFA